SNAQLEARMTEMREVFVKGLKALKSAPKIQLGPTTVAAPAPSAKPPKTLVVPIGDLHVGKKVRGHHKLGDYDYKVAQSRLRQVGDYIKEMVATHKPDRIVLIPIGDIFEAILGNMRPGQ